MGTGPRPPVQPTSAEPRRRIEPPTVSAQVIVERPLKPVLRLTRLPCPDEFGRMQTLDGLLVEFDYAGAVVPFDDDRQFVRTETATGPVFVRRDSAGEAAVLDAIRRDGLVQMRMASGQAAKGRMVFVFRGRDAAEAWQAFVAERLPALQNLGWGHRIDSDFGPRLVESVGACDMRVADVPGGRFSLDLGIEIDGVRQPLLPILLRLRERGGIAAARIVDGEVITSLDDGRILKLPAERITRLLTVMDDLIEAARHSNNEKLELDAGEAPGVLDLEDLVIARWQDGAAIAAHAARFRCVADIPAVAVPRGFTATLRPYQQHGVNWLQHLRDNGLGGLLADDMGLGKTAQTIAHIAIEEAAGRLDRPALVVVPTSLVPNWTAELARFAPHLRVVVLHGLDRHEKRRELGDAQVVITTYTVLARDIEEMAGLAWHLVVLDEAQVIKNPTAKATHAVCRLDTRHRLCLSGTPIENNLGELWSQFAFLMPGLLGSRKNFTRRFRTPIEKQGDPVRRRQLATRIRPFILRRTKSAVATELPPKHTILRRITLAPEQRELYETIRATLHDKVTREIADRGLGRSHVVVLDALLKLRQVCCDPRLVKLSSARLAGASSKLDDLLEMLGEMIVEGRRILLFSQFTSMLDLMKPALDAAGIRYVELRGDTARPGRAGAAFRGGRGAAVPDQPEGRRARAEPDLGRHGDPLRPMVEPGGRGPGVRPRTPDRADQIGVRLQADRGRYGGGADPGIAGAQGRAGEHRVQRGRSGVAERWMPRTSTSCSVRPPADWQPEVSHVEPARTYGEFSTVIPSRLVSPRDDREVATRAAEAVNREKSYGSDKRIFKRSELMIEADSRLPVVVEWFVCEGAGDCHGRILAETDGAGSWSVSSVSSVARPTGDPPRGRKAPARTGQGPRSQAASPAQWP